MSKLFKLTFTPLVDSIDTINKYKVSVEYFNKHVVGAKFDMRDNRGLGFVVFFIKDFIDVTEYYLDLCLVKAGALTSLIDNDCTIEEQYIDSYIEVINKVKPQIEEYCKEKQKEEEYMKKAFENWQQKKPIEYSF